MTVRLIHVGRLPHTVKDAIKAYQHAKKRFPEARVLLYHSRYRYEDRVCLQEQVIDEFRYVGHGKTQREHERPAIAITTQVCEMSLDISADLLVTACCPLPALVQRLGRLNRYATKGLQAKGCDSNDNPDALQAGLHVDQTRGRLSRGWRRTQHQIQLG